MTPADIPEVCVVLSRRLSRARVQYPCDGCLGSIHPGDSYHRTVTVFDGVIGTNRTHAHCPAEKT